MRKQDVQRERARYNGLSPAAFGEIVGLSADSVVRMIEDGWFRWTKDEAGNRVPECLDTRRAGAKRAAYRIHRSAVDRWFAERAVTGKAA